MTGSRSILVLLASLLAAAPLAAQNPWTRVPAFPTTCYTAGDPFPDQIEAAFTANLNALGRQEEINRGLNQQLKAVDPSVMSRRMMAYMQQDPAGFQAYMQQMAQNPDSAQAAMAARNARLVTFAKEFETLKANYAAESKATIDPALAEMMRVGDAASGASNAQRAAAIAKYNAAYVAVCEKWIVRQNFPAFLTKFKAYMIGDYLPGAVSGDLQAKRSLDMAGINTRDYQSTEPLMAVSKYINYVRTVFALRWRQPQG